ncbi:hypothetical protein SUGI_0977710 [Cryptomeria japonica]|nr:hypothetical protein SUGI_0977710 [Cryptomeria japonica]
MMGIRTTACVFVLTLLISTKTINGFAPGLQLDFYRNSCPQAEQIMKTTVNELFQNSSGIAPALIRLAVHDCFVEVINRGLLDLFSL